MLIQIGANVTKHTIISPEEISPYLYFLSVFFSPVAVPAGPSGLPRAARHRPSFLRWGGTWASAAAFLRRQGTGGYYQTDGEAGSGPRHVQFRARVSKQQSRREDGSFPRGPDHRPHRHFNPGSAAVRQAAATRWRHVKETNKWSPREVSKPSSS